MYFKNWASKYNGKNVKKNKNNPFSFSQIKKAISSDLESFKKRIKITSVGIVEIVMEMLDIELKKLILVLK